MSTACIGGDAATHPVRPTGETVELPGLHVTDGATFPACSSINPVLTIMALAHYNAQDLEATLPVATRKMTGQQMR